MEEKEIIKKIMDLRNQGLTFSEIARNLGKSIFFVYSRVNKKYLPKKLREENV